MTSFRKDKCDICLDEFWEEELEYFEMITACTECTEATYDIARVLFDVPEKEKAPLRRLYIEGETSGKVTLH